MSGEEIFEESVFSGQLYKNPPAVEERHRHRYEVNPRFISDFETAGLTFAGMGIDEGSESDIIRGEVIQRSESSQRLVKLALAGDSTALKDNVSLKLKNLTVQNGKPIDSAAPSIRMEIIELKGSDGSKA